MVGRASARRKIHVEDDLRRRHTGDRQIEWSNGGKRAAKDLSRTSIDTRSNAARMISRSTAPRIAQNGRGLAIRPLPARARRARVLVLRDGVAETEDNCPGQPAPPDANRHRFITTRLFTETAGNGDPRLRQDLHDGVADATISPQRD